MSCKSGDSLPVLLRPSGSTTEEFGDADSIKSTLYDESPELYSVTEERLVWIPFLFSSLNFLISFSPGDGTAERVDGVASVNISSGRHCSSICAMDGLDKTRSIGMKSPRRLHSAENRTALIESPPQLTKLEPSIRDVRGICSTETKISKANVVAILTETRRWWDTQQALVHVCKETMQGSRLNNGFNGK